MGAGVGALVGVVVGAGVGPAVGSEVGGAVGSNRTHFGPLLASTHVSPVNVQFVSQANVGAGVGALGTHRVEVGLSLTHSSIASLQAGLHW